MKKKIEVDIEVPSVPNFLRTKDEHAVFAITQFSNKELREIGEKWTRELIKKANKRRKPTP